VNVKTWSDPNNDFTYAAAVYVPSLSKMAEQDKKEMQKGSIVEQDKAAQSPDGGQAARGPAFKDGNNPNVPRPGGDVKPGPTGRVQDGSQL
jgi:hypothetical protein